MQKTADEVTVKQVHIKDDFWSEIQNRIINVLITLSVALVKERSAEYRGIRKLRLV